MALINIPTDHIKFRKILSIEKKPLVLKDYLKDDMSSCSSIGFRSLPCRQCCTNVRFLLEADLKKSQCSHSRTTERLLKRSRSKPVSTTISALQKASEAVINAVKLLPFPSIKSLSPSTLQSSSWRKGQLPRSFLKKLFKRSFWRKANKGEDHGEIKRWKMFREFLEETTQPSDENIITSVNTTDTTDILQSSIGNSGSSSKTNLAEKKKVSNIVGVAAGEESVNFTKDWPYEERKEQFSPVSVLDCPFDGDEEEDNSSPFEDHLARVEGTKQKLMQKIRVEERKEQCSPVSVLDCPFDGDEEEEKEEEDNSSPFEDHLARVEGTKQKLMQKIRRFESLAHLEPVDLEKRIAMAELENESLEVESPKVAFCSVPVKSDEDKQEKDREANDKIFKLLEGKIPPHSFNMRLDFSGERFIMEDNSKELVVDMGLKEFGLELIEEADNWAQGNHRELVQGWVAKEGRKAYVKEMKKNGNWIKLIEEKEEMGSALELEVFSSLVDELLIDLF